MAWRHLVITQPAKLSYKNKQLLVQIKTDIHQIPLCDVHTIVVATTRAVVTTYLMAKIVENNIKIIFCDENRNPTAELNGYYQNVKRNENVTKQIAWQQDKKDEIWDALIQAKLTSNIAFLQSLHLDTTDIETELAKMEYSDTTNREAVVAKKYFNKLFCANFVRQNDDNLNAALNYGYSILLSCFNREIAAQGYLTQLGVHHHSVKNDFNLASDLMEPFRVFVDAIVKKHEQDEFNDLVKFDLIDVLNVEVEYDHKKMYLENLIRDFVKESCNYLNQEAKIPSFLVQQDAG